MSHMGPAGSRSGLEPARPAARASVQQRRGKNAAAVLSFDRACDIIRGQRWPYNHCQSARRPGTVRTQCAPDCDRKASFPATGLAMPKLALTPSAGTQMPKQFGPTMRRQVGRAALSVAWRRSGPSPEVMTTAARVPLSPSAEIREGMVSGGVAMTASSGGSGSSSMLRKQSWPAIRRCLGLTR